MLTGAGKGLVAGVVGVAAMTLGAKVEQAFTHRPNSYVPACTLERLLGLPTKPDGQRRGFNLAMHWGPGIALGALRGVMAEGGLRGPWASVMFTVVRLTADQTQENITGVGAPPWTWPRSRSRCGSKPEMTAQTPSTIRQASVEGTPSGGAARVLSWEHLDHHLRGSGVQPVSVSGPAR